MFVAPVCLWKLLNRILLYYDLAFEMPLHKGEVAIEEWLKQYANRRYGAVSPSAQQAMICLLEGPYRPGTNGTERSSIMLHVLLLM